MIREIKMQNVASYKASTALTTDKKINLVYGLREWGEESGSKKLIYVC